MHDARAKNAGVLDLRGVEEEEAHGGRAEEGMGSAHGLVVLAIEHLGQGALRTTTGGQPTRFIVRTVLLKQTPEHTAPRGKNARPEEQAWRNRSWRW